MAVTRAFGSDPMDIVSFTEAASAVYAHSQEFSVERAFLRRMKQNGKIIDKANKFHAAGLSEAEALEAARFVNSDAPFHDEQTMALSIIAVEFGEVFDATGLHLASSRDSLLPWGPDLDEIAKTHLQIADGGAFSSFLHSADIDVIPVVLGQFGRSVAVVVADVLDRTEESIRSEVIEEPSLEFLAYSQGIATGMDRIGLSHTEVRRRVSALIRNEEQGLGRARSGLDDDSGSITRGITDTD